MTTIGHLHPTEVWQHFQLLCDTPRPSRHETLIKQRICECLTLAAKRNDQLITIREDLAGNLLLSKAASPGCEAAPGVILQSHLDMVTQQNEGTAHDFYKDPLKLHIDDGWVTARGTTLGADNGIGVAAILAVFGGSNYVHGPLEAILTVNEESGMSGAKGLQANVLNGRFLLNLDTEQEGELYVGCAGGTNITGYWQYQPEKPSTGLCFYQLSLKGLKGGHSGIDIHLGRGNAIKLINRTLSHIESAFSGLGIASINSGDMRNAIPREAFAVMALPPANEADLKLLIGRLENLYSKELSTTDPGVSLTLTPCLPAELLPHALWQSLNQCISACFTGVYRMNPEFAGVTETSNNLSSLHCKEGRIEVQCLARSLIDSQCQAAAQSVASLLKLAGAEVITNGTYAGWTPNRNSRLLAELTDLHSRTTGEAASIQVIHAGLECGILGATYPDWEMISFGPTIVGAHSPDEAVKIASVKAFWEFLLASLQHLASIRS